MEKFFDLRTPQHHLKKLEWEYAHLQHDPGNVDTALSFFVTAAHLPELVKDVQYKKLLLNQEPIVQICDELANRGKHGKIKRKKPAVLDTNYDGYVARDYVAPGYCKVTLQVTLTSEAAQKLRLGSEVIDVLSLAIRALELWRAHPAFI